MSLAYRIANANTFPNRYTPNERSIPCSFLYLHVLRRCESSFTTTDRRFRPTIKKLFHGDHSFEKVNKYCCYLHKSYVLDFIY